MGLPWGWGCPNLTDHARGLLTSLITLLLLQLGSAQLGVVGPGHPVTATVGQDVVLPCHLSPQRDARSLEVRWIRDEFSETVHHYRNGQDLYGEQIGAYAGRTELVRDGLSTGSLDLRITGLRPSDDGLYVCTVRDADAYDEAIVELEVAAPFFHNAQPWKVALALVLVLLAVSVGLGVYLFPKQAAQNRELAVKKDAELGKQVAEIEEKDARLEEQSEELAWRRCLLPQNRVKVTLDPDTAHPHLVVSQNNSSVRWESEWQQVPDTPERFDSWCCVLGLEEFKDGTHFWEVEVEVKEKAGKSARWAVGVARASVKRKGWYKIIPEEGIWAVQYYEGQLKSLTWPPTPLSLSHVPTRICVCLNCTQGQVSFINADNGVEIFTFTAASFNGESIRPWFLLWTQGTKLCLRDSTPQTLSPALGGSCPSPGTPASPLLDPAGAAQE